eukprot:1179576-Prorocentrum_minimum.AAC.3
MCDSTPDASRAAPDGEGGADPTPIRGAIRDRHGHVSSPYSASSPLKKSHLTQFFAENAGKPSEGEGTRMRKNEPRHRDVAIAAVRGARSLKRELHPTAEEPLHRRPVHGANVYGAALANGNQG